MTHERKEERDSLDNNTYISIKDGLTVWSEWRERKVKEKREIEREIEREIVNDKKWKEKLKDCHLFLEYLE